MALCPDFIGIDRHSLGNLYSSETKTNEEGLNFSTTGVECGQREVPLSTQAIANVKGDFDMLFSVIGGIAILVLNTVLRGFVLSVLWKWFMETTFRLPGITIPQALGISLIASFLTYQYVEDKRAFSTQIVVGLLTPLFFLLAGWIYSLFL